MLYTFALFLKKKTKKTMIFFRKWSFLVPSKNCLKVKKVKSHKLKKRFEVVLFFLSISIPTETDEWNECVNNRMSELGLRLQQNHPNTPLQQCTPTQTETRRCYEHTHSSSRSTRVHPGMWIHTCIETMQNALKSKHGQKTESVPVCIINMPINNVRAGVTQHFCCGFMFCRSKILETHKHPQK